MGAFYGRTQEMEALQRKNGKDHAELIAVYGRRRVGKSTLVANAFKNNIMLKFEGLEGLNESKQLEYFLNRLSYYSKAPESLPEKLRSWQHALDCLVEIMRQHQDDTEETIVIFLDEFQWLAEMKSNLVSLLKAYWDNHLRKYKQLKLIICGSISSFIVRKVIKSKALYGRIDLEIKLLPLPAKDACQALPHWSASEVLKSLMSLGGIPEYLNQLDPDRSLVQNMGELAFSQYGYFFREFEKIFISHFGKNLLYEKMTMALSSKYKTVKELEKELSIKSGGTMSDYLEDLTMAGFIEKYIPIDKPANSKIVRYRLADEYLHFYLKFVYPNRMQIVTGEVLPEQLLLGRAYQQWLGYAFERLCRKNSKTIAKHLGFSGIGYRSGSWFNRAAGNNAQVDLLFLRNDKVLTVCELKFVNQLNASKIIQAKENQLQILKRNFPNHTIQNILISGETTKVSKELERTFNQVLFAEDVFL